DQRLGQRAAGVRHGDAATYGTAERRRRAHLVDPYAGMRPRRVRHFERRLYELDSRSIARRVDGDAADAAVEVGILELAVVVHEPGVIRRRIGRAHVALRRRLQAVHDACAALVVALLVRALAQVLARRPQRLAALAE